MRLATVLALLLGVIFAGGIFLPASALQDGEPAAQEEEKAPPECPKLNKCRKKNTKEKKKCSSCERRKIYANDALCSSCARKQQICKLCGLPKKGTGGKVNFESGYKKAIASITSKDMKDFLMKFASDEMEGRDTGSAGIKKARAFLIEKLKKAGAKPLKGDSFELPWNNCANVGAVYEGSDPRLKNEYVIVGSHMDHIGLARGGNDKVNNGADDNGSGSTTNAEIMEALCTSKIPLKRSIMCLWFTGEEKGLLGSKGYCQNPAIPHSQCVAMLNVDMVGRNPNKPASLYGVGSSPAFSKVVDEAQRKYPKANVKKVMEKGSFFHRSDQANFWKHGIPVMFMFTGTHPDYHKPGDEPQKINYDRMQEIGRYVFHMMTALANSPTRPAKTPGY